VRVHLPPHPNSVAGARRTTSSFFSSLDAPDTINIDDALLAVSELVTNAINAGAQQVYLELTYQAGKLTIKVEDDAPGLPTPQHPDPDAERGRGLSIIARLAHHWTIEQTTVGKAVKVTFVAA